MKATELRIGNLVWSNYGIYDRLEDYVVLLHEDFLLTKSHCKLNIAFHFIEPIPLTEEWLLKFGFEKEQYYFTIGYNPITVDYTMMLTWIEGCEYPFYRNAYHRMQHVHQLQNLYFALTGEELTIQKQ